MGLTYAEENYLKAILRLSKPHDVTVSTNEIAAHLETSAASVTDMLKKLSDKELITYQKYKGAQLSELGNKIATKLVRKHRLWEVFLVQSLGMTWDEVHEIAEELEHIQSDPLIERLDAFLGFPKFDPHGDPIPNAQGKYTLRAQLLLTELKPGQEGVVVGVKDADTLFLRHLNDKGITIGKKAKLLTNDPYDQTVRLTIEDNELTISGKVAQNILIKLI
ncbi:MAG TPA: metal-dependent transcriptional regulator [Saprospiraceae bacterium]|nr:metal-dependent transcriptional regulator [Saprospiraceae bacterium]